MSTIRLIFNQLTTVKLIPNIKSTVHMMNNTIATVYVSLLGISDVGSSGFGYITLDGIQLVTLGGEEMIYV